MKRKLRSLVVFLVSLQLLLLIGQMEGYAILRRLDKTTQSNLEALVEHSVKLHRHDMQFDAILENTFSKEFAGRIRRNLNAQR